VIFSGHVASLVVAPDGRGDSVEAIDVSRQAIGMAYNPHSVRII
jgi:hypothetical protein